MKSAFDKIAAGLNDAIAHAMFERVHKRFPKTMKRLAEGVRD